MENSTLSKRYLTKLTANLVGMVVNLFIAAIVPRALGPGNFGNFEFLRDFFQRVVGLLNIGTIQAFYTKLSQRQNDFGLVVFYFFIIICVFFLMFVFCFSAQLTNTAKYIWPDQENVYIYLGAVWGCLTFLMKFFFHMSDAYGLTVHSEKLRIIQRVFGLGIIVSLYFAGLLNLKTLFFYHYTIIAFVCLGLIYLFTKNGKSLRRSWYLCFKQIKHYFQEFYHYCHPLVVYAIVGFIVGILDRWLLQYFAGSVQQGFFSLGFRIGAICFLFTSAMTPLILREFSIAHAQKNISEMAKLFRRYIPLLYAIAAYFACYVAVQAGKVTYIFGGEQFGAALLPVTIMAFYPIHQTYGQLSGSVFYATGQTKLYRNIGIFFQVMGLPILYLLLAPKKKIGLDAGATGLALKMVGVQFIGVNVQLYYNAKLLGLKYKKYLAHQIISLGILLLFALFSAYGLDYLFSEWSIIFRFVASGFMYTILVIGLILLYPIVFGLRKGDVHKLLAKMLFS